MKNGRQTREGGEGEKWEQWEQEVEGNSCLLMLPSRLNSLTHTVSSSSSSSSFLLFFPSLFTSLAPSRFSTVCSFSSLFLSSLLPFPRSRLSYLSWFFPSSDALNPLLVLAMLPHSSLPLPSPLPSSSPLIWSSWLSDSEVASAKERKRLQSLAAAAKSYRRNALLCTLLFYRCVFQLREALAEVAEAPFCFQLFHAFLMETEGEGGGAAGSWTNLSR